MRLGLAGRRKVGPGIVVLLVVGLLPIGPAFGSAQDIVPNPVGNGVVVTHSGMVLPVREVRDDGFVVTTTCWGEGFVEAGAYIREVDIVLDPGHGGREPGAVGRNGLSEKDLNLKIAQKAAGYLEARGYRVLLTRTSDVEVPVVVRAEIARAVDPDVFVSIHHNSGALHRVREPGTETYHQVDNPESRRLAGILYEQISGALSQYDIVWRDSSFRGANAVIRNRDRKDLYGILQYTPGMTTVITEAAYLSNTAEAQLLADPAVQAVEASAIADGIVRYLTTQDEGSGYNGARITYRRLYSGSPRGCIDSLSDNDAPSDDVFPGRYTDVAGSHRPAVLSLLGSGIPDGTECASDRFCPNDALNRWELAVWLIRVLDGVDPDSTFATWFVDIDPHMWWAPHVHRMAELELSRGCTANPARFCPDNPVTRAQIATLMARAFDLGDHSGVDYTDVPHSPHSANIETVSALGLIEECGVNPLRFCPDQVTTRAQASTILWRLLDLLASDKRPPGELSDGKHPTSGKR